MILFDSIFFDVMVLIKMYIVSRRWFLEVMLVKFNVFVLIILVYKYLVFKVYINCNVEDEFRIFNEIYIIFFFMEEIVFYGVKIEVKFFKKGLRLDVDDIFIGMFVIKYRMLLVMVDLERYRVLIEFGLDVMEFDYFLREVERIVVFSLF